MGVAGPTALAQFLFVAASFGALIACYIQSDFSVTTVFENSHSAMPLIYKITGVLGQPRRLDAAVGADPQRVRRAGRALRRQSADEPASANVLAVQSWIGGRVLSVHPVHLQPVPAPAGSAGRRPRSQSDPAGYRPRDPSAAALPRLCRLLDCVFLRGRGADRGPHRRRLGALGAAVDACRLDLPHPRHRDGLATGPITRSAGAAGGSGTRWRTPR